MKKKLTASLLCLSLLLIMLLGSTLAWFTDESGTVNTMTVGNVKIAQHQKERGGAAVTTNRPLFPVTNEAKGNVTTYTGGFNLLDPAYNALDNIVTIENTGVLSAYVRTVFAFEMLKKTVMENGQATTQWVNPIETDVLHLNVNETFDVQGNPVQSVDFGATPVVFYKYENGTYGTDAANATAAYVVGVYTYTNALLAGQTTNPSLLQFYLDKTVNNEFYEQVGNQYDILVLSQAVQTQGFANAATAFDAAFPLNATTAAEWFRTYAPAPTNP